MSLQIINDSEGNPTGIFIPFGEWKSFSKKYKGLESMVQSESSKTQLLQELKQALKELKLIEQGKLKSRSAKELLNEL